MLRSLLLLTIAAVPLYAQSAPAHSDPEAERWVRAAVDAQLSSDAHDIDWMYRDRYVQPGHSSVMLAVDTPEGGLRRTIEINGHPATASDTASDEARIRAFLADPAAQAKKRRDDAKDNAQSADLLRSWPDAFLVTMAVQTPQFVTLNYFPNPAYNPPNIQARVMGQMQGQIKIFRTGSQIYSVQGRLMHDVSVAFGIVKLKAGGTFSVERREVAPGRWQVVEEHTHIQGHALLLKSISEQEDDWKTDFKPSPAKTLAEAAQILAEEIRR